MIKNFVNELLTLVILGIGGNVVNASGNSVPVVKSREDLVIDKVNNFYVIDNNSNNSTIDSDKNSKDNSPKINKLNHINNNNNIEKNDLDNMKHNSETNSKNTINNNNRINYEPDKMWFDYQALFDKTRNIILGKENDSDNIEIKHTDFIENDLARDAVFGTDGDYAFNYNERFLDEILNCNVCAYYFALGNCFDQLIKMCNNSEANSGEMKQLQLNYNYFLALVVSFSAKYNCARMDDYMKLSSGVVPSSICEKTRNTEEMNLFEIMSPLLNKNNDISVKN